MFEGTRVLGLDQIQKVFLTGLWEMYGTGNGMQVECIAVFQQHKWQCFGLSRNKGSIPTE